MQEAAMLRTFQFNMSHIISIISRLEERVEANRNRIRTELDGKRVPTEETVITWILSQEGVEHHVQEHLKYWRGKS